jgi:hypothetical protein
MANQGFVSTKPFNSFRLTNTAFGDGWGTAYWKA